MLKTVKLIIVCQLLFLATSCKKDKVITTKEEAGKEIIMIGSGTMSGIGAPVLWTSRGSNILTNFLPPKTVNAKIYGAHLVERVGKAPVLSFIGIAKADATIGNINRVFLFIDGEKKELAALSRLAIGSLSELILSCEKDNQGNMYVGCASGYFYKIDINGKVTYFLLEPGRLIFNNGGLKSIRIDNIFNGTFAITINDLALKSNTFTYGINNILSCFTGATYVSPKKTFFFVILMDNITKIQTDYLLTVDNDTKLFKLQEIGYPNELLNFTHSTLDGDILYVAGDSRTSNPFYLAIQISDQSGPLKFTKTDLELKPGPTLISTDQILVVDKKVYVSAEYFFQTALWVDGKLVEVNNNGLGTSYPEILTSY
jgi:hypothetical protein